MKSKLFTQKLQELTKLAESEGEPNAQVILLILEGARLGNKDGMLAKRMQQYVEEVLIPEIDANRERFKATKN